MSSFRLTAIPLEKRSVEVASFAAKKLESKSSLDPSLKVDGKFTSYKALPSLPKSEQNIALYEECLARLKCIENDLKWLLGLSYGRFWCQVIHDDRLQRCLDTYLRYSPRFYDDDQNLESDDEIRSLHDRVHRRVFLTCVRMATDRETKQNFMSPTVFADIIYENYLFDVPMMMDLCVLYGRTNGPLLTKMIGHIFNHQAKYNQDLDGALMSVSQVFDTIAAQCDVSEDDVQLPPKLDWLRTGSFVSQPDKVVADLVDYVFDVCQSLTAFVDVYATAALVCYTHHVFNKLSWFYHNVVPVLKASVFERDFQTLDSGDDVKGRVRRRLSQSRALLVKLVRKIIYDSTIQRILDCSGGDVGEHVEAFLGAMTSMLNDRKFTADYVARFPFTVDVEILEQCNYKIDETRIAYIREALSIPDSAKSKTKRNRKAAKKINLKFKMSEEEAKKMRKRTVIKSTPVQESDRRSPRFDVDGMANGFDGGGAYGGAYCGAMGADLEAFGACAPAATGIELESLITSVHDIFPELGDGFIERCLDEYNYDQSGVIDAILFETLRPNVRDLDRALSRSAKRGQNGPSGAELLDERKNVYDGDEFDVFKHPHAMDLSRVTRGKKFMGAETTSIVLDDHRDVERYRETFQRYATIDQNGDAFVPHESADVLHKLAYDSMYDDEYDDTYDSADVGAMLEIEEIEENFKIQPLNEKKAPRRFHTRQDEEEKEREVLVKKRGDFHADPAKLREEREQRRASQRGEQRSEQAAATPVVEKKKHDVVGRAKGQGQEKSVVNNRDYKDKNKARMSNHNRRANADRKKAKGMF